ncbi:glycosyl hydrolase [Bacillus sp. AFS017336]|uniref:WD40/YVTN/BNR-like repeat-containing protein n=1 Tax=Bacillus sp. AFS017336 TaxID=2033489 RepID=UPI000BEF4B77|nr:glycosyl hydrolase [Bacillus sp. AFS017336]PEL09315.1 glycosyl hydrolase [Bacillus sp. AFS017336]
MTKFRYRGTYILRRNVKKILRSLLTNPVFLIGYWMFGKKLALICKFGSLNKNLPVFVLSIIILLSTIVFTTIKVIKNSEYQPNKLTTVKLWTYLSLILFISITLLYGVNIYKSGTNYNGKLAWYIERLKNQRSVKFDNNNLYKYGVKGIFEDINKKQNLPKKLYMVNNFSLKFNSDGTITSFDSFVHGKNDNGKEESYLISYDQNKSDRITIHLNGYAGTNYNDDKLLEPLIETVKVIPIKQAVSKWNESQYGLVYYGKRNWGYNLNGIINIDKDGKEYSLENTSSEIIGYTVSLFVPGMDKVILPARYNLIGNPDWSKPTITPNQASPSEKKDERTNTNEQFFQSKEVGYRLNVADKALGSTFYSLSKTTNGGNTWTVINYDPYSGTVGGASGIVFFDDKLGFLGAVNPSGNEGALYRTDDGGNSFKKVNYTLQEVKLDNGHPIKPFDTPSMPFKTNGVLNMLVGQGADGDYNGNSSELYQSEDKGRTWKFVKEVKK